jgi:hypothetical protein
MLKLTRNRNQGCNRQNNHAEMQSSQRKISAFSATLREMGCPNLKSGLFFRRLAVFFSLPDRVEPLLTTLRPIRRALDELAAD